MDLQNCRVSQGIYDIRVRVVSDIQLCRSFGLSVIHHDKKDEKLSISHFYVRWSAKQGSAKRNVS